MWFIVLLPAAVAVGPEALILPSISREMVDRC
jgi:hypothetical protein